MPHKHKRRQKGNLNNYDLPPSAIAKPLPVRPSDASHKKPSRVKRKEPNEKHNRLDEFKDDTPRAFTRMMMRLRKSPNGAITGTRIPSGLDDGIKPEKSNRKRKREEHDDDDTPKSHPTNAGPIRTTETPKILPRESLSDFAARVDLALPLSDIPRKSGFSGNLGGKIDVTPLREHRLTKHERRLSRMQREWREEEARIREREDAEREEKEAANEEVNERWRAWEVDAGKKAKKGTGKKKKRKRKTVRGEDGDDSEFDDGGDPWSRINSKARAAQSNNPFEVVQAPPTQLTKPRERFKLHGLRGAKVDVTDIPTTAGSLRRREELAGERQSIVDAYRRIMAGKRI